MPSPFPGMDPYLESPSYWGDCHVNILGAIRTDLNATLPNRYAAATELYVWIHEPDAESRRRKPDVYVSDHGSVLSRETSVATATSATRTKIVLPPIPIMGTKYLRIVDVDNQRLVTVIELLSPANKQPGPDRQAYLSKRNEYLAANVNVVEIDLLRRGSRLPLGDSPMVMSDYYVLLCRAANFPQAELDTFGIRDPIPEFAIPLDPGENEPVLSLRRCLDRVYNEGRYAMKIKYDVPPKPPLEGEDATWAREMLSQRTR